MRTLCVGVIGLSLAAQALGQDPRAEAKDWFREARFGMFIHWGVYPIDTILVLGVY